MADFDFSVYFVDTKTTRQRQGRILNDAFGSAVRGKIEEACAQNTTSCLFNVAAWNHDHPEAPVPTEQSDGLLKALHGKGFQASFKEGVYTIDWSE